MGTFGDRRELSFGGNGAPITRRNVLGLAANDNHFQAVVVIEVHVHSREDTVICIVLNIGQFLVEQSYVMIVDEGDGSQHFSVGDLPGLLHQLFPDQIAERLRACRVSTARDMPVELIQQFGIDCDSYTTELAHTS